MEYSRRLNVIHEQQSERAEAYRKNEDRFKQELAKKKDQENLKKESHDALRKKVYDTDIGLQLRRNEELK